MVIIVNIRRRYSNVKNRQNENVLTPYINAKKKSYTTYRILTNGCLRTGEEEGGIDFASASNVATLDDLRSHVGV